MKYITNLGGTEHRPVLSRLRARARFSVGVGVGGPVYVGPVYGPPVCTTATMDIIRTRARPMATTVLTGSRAASSSAPGRGFAAATMEDGASTTVTSAGDATLIITGTGFRSTKRRRLSAVRASAAAKTFMGAEAETSMVAETSTAVTHSAAARAATSTVDTEAAAMAVDADKFLSGSTPQTADTTLSAVFFCLRTSRTEASASMRRRLPTMAR